MSESSKPFVLIVGGGISGLMLGILFEKSNVPYAIFERSTAGKDFGSVYTIGPSLFPLFQQLDIYDEFLTIKGDIIVGADGAYSAVRQRMYEQLKAEGKLPLSDQQELPFTQTCLVGQTNVLDPEEYPILKEKECQFRTVLGKSRPYWVLGTTSAQNTFLFIVVQHLGQKSTKAAVEQRFRTMDNSEWGLAPVQTMCDETRNLKFPLGDGKMTMGDLYDMTPKGLISKVMLEEKVFKTWYSGRTVLLGDGGISAIHDAIALANLIYAMPSKKSNDISEIFKEYYSERYPIALQLYKNSQILKKTMSRGVASTMLRFLFTLMSRRLWKYMLAEIVKFRPQAGFLKAAETKGTITPKVSLSEKRARAIYERQQHQNSVPV
ncbi:hypothetical protein FBU30_004928 [Linnemannia zychae]|nr:hypothetical protein FBU30_004928 [Linnemannia zychae]